MSTSAGRSSLWRKRQVRRTGRSNHISGSVDRSAPCPMRPSFTSRRIATNWPTHVLVGSMRFQISPSDPPGRITRAISGTARRMSNQWAACPATAASIDARARGISSADPATAGTPATVWRNWARIRGSGSTATGECPRASSAAVSFPVPAPRSTTLLPPAVAQRTASSGYSGRPAWYADACWPKDRDWISRPVMPARGAGVTVSDGRWWDRALRSWSTPPHLPMVVGTDALAERAEGVTLRAPITLPPTPPFREGGAKRSNGETRVVLELTPHGF